MQVFITGASGHIGSAVVPELISHGHAVVGLARSEESAARLTEWGVTPLRATLDDHDALIAAAREADGVIHLAFKHELMQEGKWDLAVETDLAVQRSFGETLAGTDKPFVTTTGVLLLGTLGLDRPATEDDVLPGGPRVDAENYVVGLADQGVRSSAIRLASMVHSDLDHHGFTSALIGMARQNGFAAYVGEGENHWSGASTYDIGTLYRLALESAPAGSRFHGVESVGIRFRTIAETIADKLGIEARSIPPEEASQYLGFLGDFSQLDAPVSNAKTREVLGWAPTHPDWEADVRDGGHYFG